ncbi:hypothetical protein EJM73_08765 [Clostridium botulinum]|uniref:hypothetical protein n=1 Tax=Clostridium botulinum TaxID=1491 RepID=UPI001375B886|nr:hypothetical protein [Clostridium botulinum]NCI19715.1 hypothetical protein [Clostridium botulinum]NCI35753.1 hypothetical protein [Clostridium botulinum]NCI71610.1 hypothetical protein [Clostridium botulinum]NDI38802.1 hypothetical protein [Clostridium botulinum]
MIVSCCEKFEACQTDKKGTFCKHCIHNELKERIVYKDYFDYSTEKMFREIFKTASEIGVLEEDIKKYLDIMALNKEN